jgi:glutamate-1-semialdehyde 2,1-aminomutase
VITGFRIRPGSAQSYYGVTPDLTTLAKALGGGLPIAATVGRRKFMEALNPIGRVCSSGTSSGALMPVLAAIACMKIVKQPDFFDRLEATGNALYDGMNDLFRKHSIPGHVRGIGARFGIYFGIEDPEMDYNWREVAKYYDKDLNIRFVKSALENGLYFHDYGTSPVPPHNGYGLAHTLEDVAITLEKIDKIFSKIKK